jgi:hypothetical protein
MLDYFQGAKDGWVNCENPINRPLLEVSGMALRKFPFHMNLVREKVYLDWKITFLLMCPEDALSPVVYPDWWETQVM